MNPELEQLYYCNAIGELLMKDVASEYPDKYEAVYITTEEYEKRFPFKRLNDDNN